MMRAPCRQNCSSTSTKRHRQVSHHCIVFSQIMAFLVRRFFLKSMFVCVNIPWFCLIGNRTMVILELTAFLYLTAHFQRIKEVKGSHRKAKITTFSKIESRPHHKNCQSSCNLTRDANIMLSYLVCPMSDSCVSCLNFRSNKIITKKFEIQNTFQEILRAHTSTSKWSSTTWREDMSLLKILILSSAEATAFHCFFVVWGCCSSFTFYDPLDLSFVLVLCLIFY